MQFRTRFPPESFTLNLNPASNFTNSFCISYRKREGATWIKCRWSGSNELSTVRIRTNPASSSSSTRIWHLSGTGGHSEALALPIAKAISNSSGQSQVNANGTNQSCGPAATRTYQCQGTISTGTRAVQCKISGRVCSNTVQGKVPVATSSCINNCLPLECVTKGKPTISRKGDT